MKSFYDGMKTKSLDYHDSIDNYNYPVETIKGTMDGKLTHYEQSVHTDITVNNEIALKCWQPSPTHMQLSTCEHFN